MEKHKTNKYGYVRIDKNIYTTSPEVANQEDWVKLKTFSLEILNNYIQDGYSPEESLALINSYNFEKVPILDYLFLNSKNDNLSNYDPLMKVGE